MSWQGLTRRGGARQARRGLARQAQVGRGRRGEVWRGGSWLGRDKLGIARLSRYTFRATSSKAEQGTHNSLVLGSNPRWPNGV